jgi:ABC-type spermidine/putrescine transport system permease subunit I
MSPWSTLTLIITTIIIAVVVVVVCPAAGIPMAIPHILGLLITSFSIVASL